MLKSVFKRSIYIFILILSTLVFCDEFSEGPYGINYFDIAAPVDLPDLNLSLQGDANLDELVNVQDIVLTISHILGVELLEDENFSISDVNNDGSVDILDIVEIVSQILNF